MNNKPYKLASRDYRPEDLVIKVRDVEIGGPEVVIAAGPCAVESREQLIETAKTVKASGAKLLRGGAFKPRTSPYSFQGLGEEGLKLLAEAREVTGLPIITEVMDSEDLDLVAEYADVLQIGARNVQNFKLLQKVGKKSKPVLLKRGPAMRITELLAAAEYILAEGNSKVILCERGVVNFDTETRNLTDIAAISVLKKETYLPVFLDPSHSTGKRELIEPIGMAGIAAGADGLMIEVHIRPEQALSDGAQSLSPEGFSRAMLKFRAIASALGRKL